MKRFTILIVIISCLFIGFKEFNEIKIISPETWPEMNYDFSKSPLTKEKVYLGRVLFYDPVLSRNNAVSCANCHSPYNAFTHVDHALSHGIDDKIGTRNSPALMNLAWHSSFMWDGAINHIDMQSLAPITHPLEMNESLENVVKKLQSDIKYRKLFYKAFNDSIVTGQHTLKAIAQFMLTLVTSESRYDSVKRGQAQFTEMQGRGYRLFKTHCNSCHTEPLFTNLKFENNGLPIDKSLNDQGRYKVTKNPSDSLKFKVPTLRNIEFTFPYMHDGRFRTLKEVFRHYETGIVSSTTLPDDLKPGIKLDPNERVELVAFLLTLSDRKFLFNPELSYPRDFFFSSAKD